MENGTFMDKIRTFFGFRQEPPRNDFRNPIWGSDDDDDGDELYTRQHMNVYDDPIEFTKQMNDMFKYFSTVFGDMKSFFHDDYFENFAAITDVPTESENFDSNNIRDYYLKPGYHMKHNQNEEDLDLDGKISSNEISGLLKQKDGGHSSTPVTPFNGSLIPGRTFCQTIITTSVTKSDGSVETRKIIKKGNEVIEETTTITGPDNQSSNHPGLKPISSVEFVYGSMFSDLTSLFRNFY